MAQLPPITEAIRIALAQLFADDPVSQRNPDARPRDPSHATITECFVRSGLQAADVRAGKEKRVRAVLSWALDHDVEAGRRLTVLLVAAAKGSGGFRSDSPNAIETEAITNLRVAFRSEGWHLTSEGDLGPALVGEDLAGPQVTEVLLGYVRRAARGHEDDVLVIGTSKDLVEATAAHLLVQINGTYDRGLNFESLLAQAYLAVGLALPGEKESSQEPARKKLERGMFQAAIAINRLRNKSGIGHGRPFLPAVTDADARVAIRTMGAIADLLLDALHSPRV